MTLCSQPILNIDQLFTQQNPLVIYRSKQISFSTETYFNCNASQTLEYSWTLIQIISNNNASIFLQNNPTAYSSGLVIPKNTLDYGLYQITFSIRIALTSDGYIFMNNISTYASIIPTGVVVNALQNGIQSLLIGSNQALTFNPAFYSIDLDNLVSPQSLSFIFYCKTINMNQTSQLSQDIDLYQYKMNSTLLMESNYTCFDSNGKTTLRSQLCY